MRFTAEKINARLAELWPLRFWERRPLALQWQPGRLAQARPDAWQPAPLGTIWDGPGRWAAFRATVEAPAAWAGKPVALRLRLANYRAGDPDAPACDPQALLYVDGHPVYGLDMFHDEMVLTDAATSGQSWEIGIDAEAGIQSPHSPALLVAEVGALDQNAVDLYYDAQVALDSALLLPENDYRRGRMLKVIDEAMLRVDWRGPLDDAFRASLVEAGRHLRENLYEAMTAGFTPTVIATGHSHIDVAWLWTLAQVREKCARTFSTSLRLMEQYPEYRYIQSQPQLYQFTQQDYPEIFAGIRQRVAEGRWEPLGCTWVEMDCNLSGGESLVRQFLFGTRYFRKAFGTDGTRVLWLPDVFGYPASLPQIMARSGCPYFCTAKLTWNEYNRLPYDSFRWRGIDGTEVVSHLITIPALYWRPKVGTPISSYDAMLTPGELTGAWERYRQKDVHEELLITFGHGDGGGGSKPEMVERARRLADLPGIPRLRYGRVADFFAGLARVADRLPVWHGELYFEYHRGTYTTQAANKRANRQSEFLYHNAELFASLAHLWGQTYPQERLNRGWELILLNQFHDILPGSSIPAVYKDSQAQYAQVRAVGEAALNDALEAIAAQVNLSGPEPALIVFNSLGWSRTDVVEATIPLPGDFTLLDSAGQPVPYQIVADTPAGRTILFTAADVPSCGYRAYRLRAGASTSAVSEPVRLSGNTFENRFFRAEFSEAGQLTSLYDKAARREAIAPGKRGNVLQYFEDKPIEFDAWDIPIYYQDKVWEANEPADVRVIEAGPLRAGLEVRRTLRHSTIVQRIYAYADLPRLDFVTEVDWHEKDVLLKVAFPVDVHALNATYDIQFGNIERPTHWNTSWDWARFEVCAHKWADLSEGDYGVSLLNDCKYGYDVRDNVLRLTLLRSPKSPDPHADEGRHRFTYSLLPHRGTWRTLTVQQGYHLNVPLLARFTAAHDGGRPAAYSLVAVDAPNVIMETVKRAEDDIALVVRVYECHNQRGPVTLTFGEPVADARECNLLEEEETPVEFGGRQIRFAIKPYQIRTFKVWLE